MRAKKTTAPNGVAKGLRVVDLDGKDLGRVVRLYDWGFHVRKGLPLLVRDDFVVRYDEVRGVEDGAIAVARSDRDLLALAAGGVPDSWRVRAPPGFPSYATPEEARAVVAELAAGPLGSAPARGDEAGAPEAYGDEELRPPEPREAQPHA